MNKVLNRLLPLVILIPGIFLAFYWNSLPAEVPMHFDINGNPDRFGSKKELLVMVIALSAVSILVYLLLLNIYRIDPKKYAAENKLRLQRIGFAVTVFLSALVCFIIYSASRGGSRFDLSLILGAVGLLFAVIGNYLPNLKPNYFAGMRLPWTLENPENWRKTHALAGKLWFAGGILLAITCVFLPARAAMILFFVVVLILVIIPTIYSYQYYRQHKKSGPGQ
ncbi:MAG: SdpI family protein [Sphingobacteriales bacterium]|nr:SdpI family protein [Sphingobacteriales bacterium]